MHWCFKTSVADPWNFGTDPGPDADPYLWLMNPDADPYLWLIDPDTEPDPAILYSDLQDVNRKNKFLSYLLITFWRYIYIIFQR